MGTQAAPQAGNTVETLRSTPVETVLESLLTDMPQELVAQLKGSISPTAGLRDRQHTAAARPTGPEPVEYAPPALGPKSPDGNNADVLDGSTMQPDIPRRTSFGTGLYVSRDEFDELLERIEIFNQRSSQKI